ncbi:MAG: hypothetical protein KF851_13800 [Pirellulaceae bacterium]|nr:hypothetical protein [Pirellulaceae bacterium]
MNPETDITAIHGEARMRGWERVAMAIEKVRARLLKITAVLNEAGIPYAVIGGNAVAEWVGRVDEGAVRFTKNVDILLRRLDMPQVIDAAKKAGFHYAETIGIPILLDSPDALPSSAVHVIYADERVKADDLAAAPDVEDVDHGDIFCVLSLEKLVQMKLTSYRRKDQVHLLDMLGVGLIDANWPDRYPAPLAARLQDLIDNPE